MIQYTDIQFVDGIKILGIDNLFDMGMPQHYGESSEWIAKNLSDVPYYSYVKEDGYANHNFHLYQAVERAQSQGADTVIIEYLS